MTKMHEGEMRAEELQTQGSAEAAGHTRRRFLHGSSAFIGIAALSGGACSRGADNAAAKATDAALDAIADEAKNFSATEFRTLTRVADLIIPETDTPGALGAEVPKYLDGLMSDWASANTQGKMHAALAHIEGKAQAGKGKAFAALSPEDQHQLLTEIDAACFAEGDNFDGEDGARNGYRQLKRLVFYGYYRSEIGCEQELQFELVPGPEARGDAPLAEVGRTWVE
jgi:hypothetical protein